jgi:hypothetical protein
MLEDWINAQNQAHLDSVDPPTPAPHPRCLGPICPSCGKDARNQPWTTIVNLVCTGCSGVDCGSRSLVCDCNIPHELMVLFTGIECPLCAPLGPAIQVMRGSIFDYSHHLTVMREAQGRFGAAPDEPRQSTGHFDSEMSQTSPEQSDEDVDSTPSTPDSMPGLVRPLSTSTLQEVRDYCSTSAAWRRRHLPVDHENFHAWDGAYLARHFVTFGPQMTPREQYSFRSYPYLTAGNLPIGLGIIRDPSFYTDTPAVLNVHTHTRFMAPTPSMHSGIEEQPNSNTLSSSSWSTSSGPGMGTDLRLVASRTAAADR